MRITVQGQGAEDLDIPHPNMVDPVKSKDPQYSTIISSTSSKLNPYIVESSKRIFASKRNSKKDEQSVDRMLNKPSLKISIKMPKKEEEQTQEQCQHTNSFRVKILKTATIPVLNQENKFCRICYDSDHSNLNKGLITPCNCQGSVKYIHEDCLKTWITVHFKDEGGQAKCEICNFVYKMKYETIKIYSSNKCCLETKRLLRKNLQYLICFLILCSFIYILTVW